METVRCSEYTLQLAVKKGVEFHVSLQTNVSRIPFIFFNLSRFSILLVTTCLLKGLFTKDIYHGTIMIYDTKTKSCTIIAGELSKTV